MQRTMAKVQALERALKKTMAKVQALERQVTQEKAKETTGGVVARPPVSEEARRRNRETWTKGPYPAIRPLR